MTHDEMIEVIKAHKDGKDLEVKSKMRGAAWYSRPNKGPNDVRLNFDDYDYRVKKEPRMLYARIDERGYVGSASTDRTVIEKSHRAHGGEIVKFMEVMED